MDFEVNHKVAEICAGLAEYIGLLKCAVPSLIVYSYSRITLVANAVSAWAKYDKNTSLQELLSQVMEQEKVDEGKMIEIEIKYYQSQKNMGL